MNRRILFTAVLTAMVSLSGFNVHAQEEDRWEKDMQKFEAMDQQSPPPKNAMLFLGSSSIRLWDLKKWFPDFAAINRGFGGSQISDSIKYADRIVIPYQPKAIVFYAGDNDVAGGKSAETVFEDYQTLVAKVHQSLPDTKFFYIPIKPSIKRWEMWETMKKANAMIEAWSKESDKLDYIDTATPMLGDDGKPMADLFVEDGLHLNEKGYELWTKIVKAKLALKRN